MKKMDLKNMSADRLIGLNLATHLNGPLGIAVLW